MFKAALKWFVRLLPFAAAMVATVAIGASTRVPETWEAVASQSVGHHGPAMVALQSVRRVDSIAAGATIHAQLIARADTVDLLATGYPVESLDSALTTLPPGVLARADVRPAFERPRPDRWTSLLATLALGAFFFLRRIV